MGSIDIATTLLQAMTWCHTDTFKFYVVCRHKISFCNGLMPPGNKPSPEAILTVIIRFRSQIYTKRRFGPESILPWVTYRLISRICDLNCLVYVTYTCFSGMCASRGFTVMFFIPLKFRAHTSYQLGAMNLTYRDGRMRQQTRPPLLQITVCGCSVPSHYLNQCPLIIIWTNCALLWNVKSHTTIFIQQDEFVNVVCKISVIGLGLNVLA